MSYPKMPWGGPWGGGWAAAGTIPEDFIRQIIPLSQHNDGIGPSRSLTPGIKVSIISSRDIPPWEVVV